MSNEINTSHGESEYWHPSSQSYRALGAQKSPPELWRQLPSLKFDPDKQLRDILNIVDNSSGDSPIQNQGNVGACVAFGLTALMERITKRNGGGAKYSELFLYYCGRVLIEGTPASEDSGMYNYQALQALRTYGLGYGLDWPYTKNYWDRPTPPVFSTALHNQVIEARALDTSVGAWKAVLSTGTGLVCAFEVHRNWWSGNSATITYPISGDVKVGGHCVEIVGYDDTKSMFKFKNSWGINFGENGYGYMPYGFLTLKSLVGDWKCVYDSLVITAIEMYTDNVVVRSLPINFAEWGLQTVEPTNDYGEAASV